MSNQSPSENNFKAAMNPIVARFDQAKWDTARGVTLGGAGLSTAIIFLVAQIGPDSSSLSIALFCSSLAVPAWLALWRIGEAYSFFGPKSYGHLSARHGLAVGLVLFSVAACLLLTGFVTLIWHFSKASAIAFLVGTVCMAFIVTRHQASVQSWTAQEPNDDAKHSTPAEPASPPPLIQALGHPMHLAKLIKTASPQANGLTLGSIILLLAKIFFFNEIPELFSGAYELGVLSDAILTSVVASYVFYLIVVHLKEQTDRETVRPYIAKHAKRIVGDCEALLVEISKASGNSLALSSSKSQVEISLKSVAPRSPAPLLLSDLGRNANWLEFFSYRHARTKASCRKLLDQLPLLDAKLISLVAAIEDCSFFSQVEMVIATPFNNGDMTFLTSSLHGYTNLCEKLDELVKSSELAHAP